MCADTDSEWSKLMVQAVEEGTFAVLCTMMALLDEIRLEVKSIRERD